MEERSQWNISSLRITLYPTAGTFHFIWPTRKKQRRDRRNASSRFADPLLPISRYLQLRSRVLQHNGGKMPLHLIGHNRLRSRFSSRQRKWRTVISSGHRLAAEIDPD
jgi:hypothetical protein